MKGQFFLMRNSMRSFFSHSNLANEWTSDMLSVRISEYKQKLPTDWIAVFILWFALLTFVLIILCFFFFFNKISNCRFGYPIENAMIKFRCLWICVIARCSLFTLHYTKKRRFSFVFSICCAVPWPPYTMYGEILDMLHVLRKVLRPIKSNAEFERKINNAASEACTNISNIYSSHYNVWFINCEPEPWLA